MKPKSPRPKIGQTNAAKPVTSNNRAPLALYHIIIQCTDEAQQRQLYERLSRAGHRCRLTVL